MTPSEAPLDPVADGAAESGRLAQARRRGFGGVKGRYLIDKFALACRGKPAVRARLDVLDRDGLLAVCAPTEYEVLYSPRGKPEALRLRSLLRGFDYLPCNDGVFEQALKIQALALNMAVTGRCRWPTSSSRQPQNGTGPPSCTMTATST